LVASARIYSYNLYWEDVRKLISHKGLNADMENSVKTFRSMSRRQSKLSRVCFIFCLLITSLFYLTAAINTATAATYYVDFESGDNSAVGTSPDTAWKHAPGDSKATANPASLRLQPGDTVLFKGGVVYRGRIAIESGGGTVGNPITYKGNGWPGLEGVKATIDGSEIIEGPWTQCESQEACAGNANWQNIYYAYAPAEAEVLSSNLYQDQEPLAISQHPNPLDPFSVEIRSTYWKIPLSDVTRTSLIDPRLETFGENLIGSYLAILAYSANIFYERITGYDSATHTLYFEDIGRDPSAEPTSYSILNSIDSNVLDTIGEYYLNETPEPDGRHKVYIWPLENPNDSEITVSVRNIALYTNMNYITIEGFILQKSKVYVIATTSNPQQGLIFRNNEVSKIRAAAKTDAVSFRDFSDVVIENNYVHHTSNARGISISGSNILVKDNTFTKVGGTVLSVDGGNGNRIIGNYIYDCRGAHANGMSTYDGPSNLLVANNIVINTPRPYTFSAREEPRPPINNITVYNNIFDAREFGGNVVAQWSDRTTGSIIFMNNIIIGSAADGAMILGGGDATYIVRNNIIDGWGNNPYDRSNNIWTGLSWSQTKDQGWTPGPGSIVDTGTGGEYDEVDMTTVFVNMPAYEAQIFAVIDVSTFYLYAEEWTDRIQVGDIIEYNEDGIARTVTSKEDIRDADYSSWRWFTKITFEPSVSMEENRVVAIWKNNTNFIRDIRLKPGSIAIDAGIDVTPYLADAIQRFPDYDFSRDIVGNARDATPDAGCYEYVSSDPDNSAPVLQAIGNKSVNENSALSFSISATDADSDTITYSATGLPSGAVFSGQNFNWTPGYTQADTYQVTFTASDGQAQNSETITITVNNVNRAPVLEVISDKSVNENSILSFSISAADADGDTVTYSVGNLPTGATFGSQTLTWTPGYNQEGTYQVTFTASDSQAQDSETITITVNNVNRVPVLSAIGNKSVYADNLLTFSVNAADPDGDAITYSANVLPTGATFANQSFSWTPSQSQRGSYEVTFIASDSQLGGSETITITVDSDTSAPSVTNHSPTTDSIQAATNTLVILHIVDTGKGVDANSATIKVNDNTVYTGNTDKYSSEYGRCRRTGTKADYTFVYQPDEAFDFDQTVTITANATDLAGNAMDEYSYSFKSEMRSFGENKILSSGSSNDNWGPLTTVSDSSGNIWVAWPQGVVGSRDIYVGKLVAGTDSFVSSGVVQVTNDIPDQGNPVIAVDSSDKLYLAWQDNRYGEWDIFVSTSTDGINWSAQTKVTDPNSNQINPAIAIDSSDKVYIAWEDDQNSNKNIYIASSTNSFATKTISQITSNTYDQTTPAIAVDSDDTVYVVWTDQRNVGGGKIPKPQNDIFGAASNDSWVNIPIVTKEESQSNPAIATEAVGSVLHLVWLDDTNGDDDIYYASTSNGLPSSPLTGSSIIDDTTGADQLSPVIITTGYTGNDLKVFACWRDERNADADLYFAETTAYGTNVFVGDDNTSSDQSEPAIGIDEYGQPYIVWINDRTDICYAGSTFIEPTALASVTAPVSTTTTVGTVPGSITNMDDVSIIVPAAAYCCDVKITISRIRNPHKPPSNNRTFLHEFGPSGTTFSEPVTITIPYNATTLVSSPSAYWYNPLTDLYSQEGITDVEVIQISSGLYALRFKTTHFSVFGGGGLFDGGGPFGGGGGGCSISPYSQGNIMEFLLPYLGLTVVMIILRLRDARNQKARTIAKGKC